MKGVLPMRDGNLRYIEDCFTDLQLKSAPQERKLEDIKRVLNRQFNQGIECHSIMVSENDGDPFVMSVYPIQKQLDALANDILYNNHDDRIKHTVDNIKYIVEIDASVLHDMVARFTAPELTAVLLHEVGHIMDYKAKHREMKDLYATAVSNERIQSDEYDIITEGSNKKVKSVANMITRIYIIDYLKHSPFFNTPESIMMEKRADKFVVDHGYGNEIKSAVHKIQKFYRIRLATSLNAMANASAYVKMMMACRTRKRYIMEQLKVESERERRSFVKKMITQFHTMLFKVGFSSEDRIKLYSTGIQEGMLRNILSPIRVSQKDIDILHVEKEMIDSVDDKMSVVYKIHKRISQLDDSAITYKEDRVKMGTINNYRTQLLDLLKKTKDVQIKPKEYGVFVQYPEGYEG